jgi:tetratricopeptide (TPR) repeat protein
MDGFKAARNMSSGSSENAVLKRYVIIGLLMAAGVAGCAPSHPIKSASPPTVVVDHSRDSAVSAQQVDDAMKLVADKNWPQALMALQSISEAKSFTSLSDDTQYRVLKTASNTALYHGTPELAHQYSVRLVSMRQADFDDWQDRVRAAGKLNDKVDGISSLTVMVLRWPDRFAPSSDSASLNGYVRQVIKLAPQRPRVSVFPLLMALYNAHWKLDWGIEPSDAWRDLALLLAQNGRFAEAVDVAHHVNDVYDLIAMRADRRFDAVVAAIPAQFDIQAAANRGLLDFQDATERSPQSLELRIGVIRSLIRLRRYEAALAASDSILSDIKSTNYPERLYSDFSDTAPWFLHTRAIALERLGRWDEAISQLSVASLMTGKKYGNVDQLLALAGDYCGLGRPNDALATINRISAKTSAAGQMLLEVEQLDAAVQLGDSKRASRSLEYLKSHRTDRPPMYLMALIEMNQLDGAAQELIRQLRDENERREALLGAQDFPLHPLAARDMRLEAERRALISRPDVRRAIDKVGRVESYPLENPVF